MIVTLLALLAIQAEPAVTMQRPVQIAPPTTSWQPTRQQQMLADGRALVLQAERLNTAYRPAKGQPSKAELQASIDRMKGEIGTLSGLSEMQSMRLQMYMERYNKAFSTLSNLMKKASDTQDSIVQNIK